jgi:hypothetical protein
MDKVQNPCNFEPVYGLDNWGIIPVRPLSISWLTLVASANELSPKIKKENVLQD